MYIYIYEKYKSAEDERGFAKAREEIFKIHSSFLKFGRELFYGVVRKQTGRGLLRWILVKKFLPPVID